MCLLSLAALAVQDVDMNEEGVTNNQDAGEALAEGLRAGADPDTTSNTQPDAPKTEGGLVIDEAANKDGDESKNDNPNESEDEDGAEKRYPRRTQQKTSLEDTGLPPLLANMGWGGKQIKVTIRIEGGTLQTSSPSILGGSPPRLGGRGGRGRGGRGRE